jgi:hypothetical protein
MLIGGLHATHLLDKKSAIPASKNDADQIHGSLKFGHPFPSNHVFSAESVSFSICFNCKK